MINAIGESWDRFWFSNRAASCTNLTRCSLCWVVAIWFLSFLPTANDWFGETGILSPDLSAQFVAFEETPRWQLWSPLWWGTSSIFVQFWIIAGVALGVLAGVGVGGRVTLAILWLWSLAWIHRIGWLSGAVEPAIAASLGYLIIAPGTVLRNAHPATSRTASSDWLPNLVLRLIQVHFWLLLAAGVLSQLGGLVWWRGEAVWWLAANGQSQLLNIDMFRDRAWLVNVLTHGTITIQLLTLWLLTIPIARTLGIACGLLSCFSIGLLADQTLYAAFLAAGLTAYLPWATLQESTAEAE
ncbi:hypothetical protein [Aureliella helgolandensis]|uniref:HTTM domain-containing protein n=1 Tax=Aureliella helgolandensis TaxID=2527968 RepID=A0A518G7C2_9BACT|nr:hypothetical protein [Aureliella helgolandensis]QDV24482.1 hypothetical protein Q31a_28000 [Aureliella helgolandensis]